MLVLFAPVLVMRSPSAPGPCAMRFGSKAQLILPYQWQIVEVQEDALSEEM